MSMEIREMQAEDYKQVHDLIVTEMGHKEVKFEEFVNWLAIMKSKNYYSYVATIDNNIAGFISANEAVGCIDGSYIDIDCLVVSYQYQGKGIGGALLQFIEDYSLSKGITKFSLTSGFHRKEAHDFYEKHNYEKGGYAFYKGLEILDEARKQADKVQ